MDTLMVANVLGPSPSGVRNRMNRLLLFAGFSTRMSVPSSWGGWATEYTPANAGPVRTMFASVTARVAVLNVKPPEKTDVPAANVADAPGVNV
jgi:hypothetical protein